MANQNMKLISWDVVNYHTKLSQMRPVLGESSWLQIVQKQFSSSEINIVFFSKVETDN